MTTDSNVVRIASAVGQAEIVDMAETLLRRAYAGQVLGLALVEHRLGDEVAIEICNPSHSYHHLTSGAARLLHTLVDAPMED